MGVNDTSDTEQCWHPECENRATAVYEGHSPQHGTIRRKACWEHGTKTTPVRYLQTGTEHTDTEGKGANHD